MNVWPAISVFLTSNYTQPYKTTCREARRFSYNVDDLSQPFDCSTAPASNSVNSGAGIRVHRTSLPLDCHCVATVPRWWPTQYAVPFVIHSSAQVTYSATAPRVETQPRIYVHSCLSTKSYLNSLSKKQHAEQASGSNPFIVICDVTHLPGAFGWYTDNLPQILKTWSRSLWAILLFRRRIAGLDSLQFEYQLYRKRHPLNSRSAFQCRSRASEYPVQFCAGTSFAGKWVKVTAPRQYSPNHQRATNFRGCEFSFIASFIALTMSLRTKHVSYPMSTQFNLGGAGFARPDE